LFNTTLDVGLNVTERGLETPLSRDVPNQSTLST